MSANQDRRIAEADRLARIETKIDTIIVHQEKQNGRLDKAEDDVISLKLSRARNAWLIRAAGIVGLAGAVKAFTASGGAAEALKALPK